MLIFHSYVSLPEGLILRVFLISTPTQPFSQEHPSFIVDFPHGTRSLFVRGFPSHVWWLEGMLNISRLLGIQGLESGHLYLHNLHTHLAYMNTIWLDAKLTALRQWDCKIWYFFQGNHPQMIQDGPISVGIWPNLCHDSTAAMSCWSMLGIPGDLLKGVRLVLR